MALQGMGTDDGLSEHGPGRSPPRQSVTNRKWAVEFSLTMPFQEQVLNAGDVCNSCFALIRRKRHRRTSATLRSDVSAQKSEYARVERTTNIDHTPTGTPTDCTVVWCDCGAESAFDRWWDDGDDRCLTMPRVRELLKRCIYTLEYKGVHLDRESCIKATLAHYRAEHDLNAALKHGVAVGVYATGSGGGSDRATAD